jgi:hypothetical protein
MKVHQTQRPAWAFVSRTRLRLRRFLLKYIAEWEPDPALESYPAALHSHQLKFLSR